MTVGRLLGIVLTMAIVAGALGALSISAQMQAVAVGAAESSPQGRPHVIRTIDEAAYLETNLVREGQKLLLFPQTGEVIVSDGKQVRYPDRTYLFKDGKIYTWIDGHMKRVWLFGVIADCPPSITVHQRPPRGS